ncbi:hypothetical protein [Dictyobacter kobayashii]|uniref:Uncharacterized protein n=1 Tax=Dictyobacter kobayashii TaxID=2014872 RepID=A0A402AFK3_9CHLR|nr:hypothetical protein [Dictyobacter kobayashii]GCE17844.1 hypothetical protein KDK_16440 [Dictyobacter kobayashii]
MEQSSYVRATRRGSTQQGPAMPDIFDEEYDDIWPSSRSSSSVRRYRSDVQTETGRPRGDEQWSAYTDPRVSRPTGKNAVPARRTASHPPVSSSASRRQVDTEDVGVPARRPRPTSVHDEARRMHWTVYAGLAMISMMVGWMILSGVAHWWQGVEDDWHYGRPRTSQTDQVVGHHDSASNPSHFIAMNLNRHIQVIEFQGATRRTPKYMWGLS